MESAGNDDGGLTRRHVLRTPFSTSLECSKITFALNSARKQTTAIFAWIALASRFLLPLLAWTSPPPFVVRTLSTLARGEIDPAFQRSRRPLSEDDDSFARSLLLRGICSRGPMALQGFAETYWVILTDRVIYVYIYVMHYNKIFLL